MNSLFNRSITFVVRNDIHSSCGKEKKVRQESIAWLSDFTAEGISFSHHKADSTGSKCIVCHASKTEVNAVKWDSRDHTFKFVSPAETIKSGTPNACTNCHKDQTPEWAQETVSEWLLK